MGVSFLVVNLDKEEYLSPHKFGEGYKFGEFANLTLRALSILLADSYGEDPFGSWAGDRIILAHDSAERDGAFLTLDQAKRFLAAKPAEKHYPPQFEAFLRENPGAAEYSERLEQRLPNVYAFACRCCKDVSDSLVVTLWNEPDLREDVERLLSDKSFMTRSEADVVKLKQAIKRRFGESNE